MTSPWFLVATAACSAGAVAVASWLAGGVGVVPLVIGLAFALAAMLIVAWVLAAQPRPSPAAAVVEPGPEASPASPARDALALCLEDGEALRGTLEPGGSDARVAAWIESARATVERDSPGSAGYFNALATHVYTDDVARLDAHLRRLATIVGERSTGDGPPVPAN